MPHYHQYKRMHALTKRLRGDCEKVAEERDNAVTQREQAIAECDLAIVQREQAVAECEEAIHESNQAKNDLEEVKHERDMLKAMLEQERQEYLVVKEEMFKLKLDRRLMQAKLDDSNFKVEKLRGKLAAFQEENCYQQEPSVPTTKGQEHWMSTPSMNASPESFPINNISNDHDDDDDDSNFPQHESFTLHPPPPYFVGIPHAVLPFGFDPRVAAMPPSPTFWPSAQPQQQMAQQHVNNNNNNMVPHRQLNHQAMMYHPQHQYHHDMYSPMNYVTDNNHNNFQWQ